MNTKQIYDEIMSHGPEWIRKYLRLVKLYKEATPENKLKALDMLRNGGRSHDTQ